MIETPYKKKRILDVVEKVFDLFDDIVDGKIRKENVAVPYLLGTPGIGKTEIIKQVANDRGYALVSVHFGTMPIEMISGIPTFVKLYVDGKEVTGTEWSIPEIISNLYRVMREENKDKGILFLDDLHLASPQLMSNLFELLTNYAIHGHKMPDNTFIICAGNDSSLAGANSMFSAIINRCGIYPVTASVKDWIEGYAIPKNLNTAYVSFIDANGSKYFVMEESITEPWASPRAHTRACYMLDILEKNKRKYNSIEDYYDDIRYYLSGIVGKEVAVEFIAYYKFYGNVDVKKYYDNILEISFDTLVKDIKDMKASEKVATAYRIGSHIAKNYLEFLLEGEDYVIIDGKKYKKFDNNDNVNRLMAKDILVSKEEKAIIDRMAKIISAYIRANEPELGITIIRVFSRNIQRKIGNDTSKLFPIGIMGTKLGMEIFKYCNIKKDINQNMIKLMKFEDIINKVIDGIEETKTQTYI